MSLNCQPVDAQPIVSSRSSTHTTESTSEESCSDSALSPPPYSELVDEKGLLMRCIDLPEVSWDDLPTLKAAIKAMIAENPWIPGFFQWAEKADIGLGLIELRGSSPPFHLLQSPSYRDKLQAVMGEPIDEGIIEGLHPPQDLDFWVKCESGYDWKKLKGWFEGEGLTVDCVNNGKSELLAIRIPGLDFLVYKQILYPSVLTLKCLSLHFDSDFSKCHLVSEMANPMQPLVDRARGMARFCHWKAEGPKGWLRLIIATTQGCVCVEHEEKVRKRVHVTADLISSWITNSHLSPLSALALLSNIQFYAPDLQSISSEDFPHSPESDPLVALYLQSNPIAFQSALAACADWIYQGYLQSLKEISVRIREHECGKRTAYELRMGTLTFHLPILNSPLPQKAYLDALGLVKGEVSGPEALSEALLTSEDFGEILLGGMISPNVKRVRKIFLENLPDLLLLGGMIVEQLYSVLGETIPCDSPIELWDFLKQNNAERGLSRLIDLEQPALERDLVPYLTRSRSNGVDLLGRMATVERVLTCLRALPLSADPLGTPLPNAISQIAEELCRSEDEERRFFGSLISDKVDLARIPPFQTRERDIILFERLMVQEGLTRAIDLWDWLYSQKCSSLLERSVAIFLNDLKKRLLDYTLQSPKKAAVLFTFIAGQPNLSSSKILLLYCRCIKRLSKMDQVIITPWAIALLPHLEEHERLEKKQQKPFLESAFFTVMQLSKSEAHALVLTFCEATEKLQRIYTCREKFMPAYCVALFAQRSKKIDKRMLALGIKLLTKEKDKRYLVSICEHPVAGLSAFWWQTLRFWPECPINLLRRYCNTTICTKLRLGEIPPEIQKRFENFSYDSKRVNDDCKELKTRPVTPRLRMTFVRFIAAAKVSLSVSNLILQWVRERKIALHHPIVLGYWKRAISEDPKKAFSALEKVTSIPIELSILLISNLLDLPKGFASAVRCLQKTSCDSSALLKLATDLLRRGAADEAIPLKQCERVYAHQPLHKPEWTDRNILWSLQLLRRHLRELRTERVREKRRIYSLSCFNAHLAATVIRLGVLYYSGALLEKRKRLRAHLNQPDFWEALCFPHEKTQETLAAVTYFFLLLDKMGWIEDEIFESYGEALIQRLKGWQHKDAIVTLNGLTSYFLTRPSQSPQSRLKVAVRYFHNVLTYTQEDLSRYALASVGQRLRTLWEAASNDPGLPDHLKILTDKLAADPKKKAWVNQMEVFTRAGEVLPIDVSEGSLDQWVLQHYTLFGAHQLQKIPQISLQIMGILKEALTQVDANVSPDVHEEARKLSIHWDLKQLAFHRDMKEVSGAEWHQLLDNCLTTRLPECTALTHVLLYLLKQEAVPVDRIAKVYAYAARNYYDVMTFVKVPALCIALIPSFENDLTRQQVIRKVISTALIRFFQTKEPITRFLVPIEAILGQPFVQQEWAPPDLFLQLLISYAMCLKVNTEPRTSALLAERIKTRFQSTLISLFALEVPTDQPIDETTDYECTKAFFDRSKTWEALTEMCGRAECKAVLFDMVFLVDVAQQKGFLANQEQVHAVASPLINALVRQQNLSSVLFVYYLINIFERAEAGPAGWSVESIYMDSNYILNRVCEIRLIRRNETDRSVPQHLNEFIEAAEDLNEEQRLERDRVVLSRLLDILPLHSLNPALRDVLEGNIQALITHDCRYEQHISDLIEAKGDARLKEILRGSFAKIVTLSKAH